MWKIIGWPLGIIAALIFMNQGGVSQAQTFANTSFDILGKTGGVVWGGTSYLFGGVGEGMDSGGGSGIQSTDYQFGNTPERPQRDGDRTTPVRQRGDVAASTRGDR